MRKILKTAAATAAGAGLLAFGFAAGSGGSALAGTDRPVAAPMVTGSSVAGCTAEIGLIAIGVVPNCTADPGEVDNPTSLTVTLNTTALGALINLIPGLGMKASWTLSCVVNGGVVSHSDSFTVTTTAQSDSSTVNLQSTMGSSEVNQCVISDLKATTTLALSLGALGLSPFVVGVQATATSAVPGAIYQDAGTASSGANAVLCADDTGNGNAGARIQAYTCLSDLADYYVYTSTDQLVHNGDCLALNSGKVVLARCASGDSGQQWSQSTIGGELRNQSGNVCLTAPSAKDGTQLTVTACASKSDQKWHIPPVTA